MKLTEQRREELERRLNVLSRVPVTVALNGQVKVVRA